MRATFEIGNPAEEGTSWNEEIEPSPLPGDKIVHNGHTYLIRPFPLYTQEYNWGPLSGTFRLVELSDGPSA